MRWLRTCGRTGGIRCRSGGYSYPSPAARNGAPCRFVVRDRIVQTSLQTVPILIGRLSVEAHLMLLSWLDPHVNAFGDLDKRPRP
ncbi:MAG: hypothetical protein QOH09_4883 [Pseudonocardiales bacterium]|jgi:hypothetical protein|nr:hypothetical protein [Pseudonocardiales bacterium]